MGSLASCNKPQSAVIEKPNVLLISIDDLNNWIEPLGGHPQAQTPNLASFAQEAVTFRHSYTVSPSCNPSRTAMMTGRMPWETGLYTNPQIWRHVVGDEVVMPEYFRESGYYSAGAGKIYHANMPDPRSWDDNFPDRIKQLPDYYLPVQDPTTGARRFALTDNEIREDDPDGVTMTMPPFRGSYIAFDFAPLPVETEETGDYSSIQWISDQLKKKHDRPFFLAAGIYRPHLPWYVPQKYFDKFPLADIQLPVVMENDLDDVPELGQNVARNRYHEKVLEADLWKQAVQGYLASINYADELVGKLLQDLAESEYADNTIVVIFSDHGWQLGEKEHWRKFSLWEDVLNTVLMVKAPPGIPGLPSGSYVGGVSDRNVSLVDIFPTLTELVGLPGKKGVSGKSLIPLLKNPEAEWNYPVVSSLDDDKYSVMYNGWHLIQYAGVQNELYDLASDPNEWTNLAGTEDQQDRIAEMAAFIPSERKPFVKTASLRWEDVLSGKVSFEKK
jgi:arylsulfatase A-like enzyme